MTRNEMPNPVEILGDEDFIRLFGCPNLCFGFINCLLGESFDDNREKAQKLFGHISRVIVATRSTPKVVALHHWLNTELGLMRGGQQIPIIPWVFEGEEPDWTNALAVAEHKATTMVQQLKRSGRNGGDTLVVAFDTVAWVNGTPFHNLSRKISENGKSAELLEDRKKELIDAYSDPMGSVIRMDVAASVSASKGSGEHATYLREGVFTKLTLYLKPIPPAVIAEVFDEKIGMVFDINSGLPMVDIDSPLADYICAYSIDMGAMRFDKTAGDAIWDWQRAQPQIHDFSQMNQIEREKHMTHIRLMVRGNLPPNMNDILDGKYMRKKGHHG